MSKDGKRDTVSRNRLRRWGHIYLVVLAGALLVTLAQAQEAPASPSSNNDPTAPIQVGPRETVGKESVTSQAARSVISGLTGGSGSRSRKSKGPKTRKDPTRKTKYAKTADNEIEVGARATWRNDDLLVSSRIEESDDKGTFQSVFLQDCSGRLLYPARIEIYKIWTKHSISVSWSKTTTTNGRVTDSQSGGWSDSWTEEWSSPIAGSNEVSEAPGIWQQSGYDRAQGGVRQMGAYFNVDPADFEQCDLAFIAHVTRPEQDPVVTQAMPFIVIQADNEKPVVKPTDRETIATRSVSAAVPPCVEALLSIENKKSALLAKLDDPGIYLQAALAAAKDVGNATRAVGIANANLAAEQALLENGKSNLEAWDQWFQERMEQREQKRYERHGARVPSWARGSRERAEKRHQENTAALRQQVQAQQENVAQARQAATAAVQAQQSAQARFNQALENFKRALAALRNAKDQFAELVVRHYRCSPCEVIASHWASAARLNDLLDRLAAMLGQAQASVVAQLPQARQAAADAAQAASDAASRLADLENRRSQIEQELRNAVNTKNGCLSLEPVEGSGWMNLASMDSTKGTILPEGAMMSWRSSFKGMDVRVWAKPGCLRDKINGIKWGRVNRLNEELHNLQSELAEAELEAAESKRAASIAQAAVDGLQAELDALNKLEKALRNSGLKKNTEDVLDRLDKLSEDCEQEMKETIRGASDASKRQREADRRTAAGTARETAARRRAGRAADEVDDIDPSDGDPDDKARHDDLKKRARDLAGGGDDEPTPGPVESPPPPETLEEAENRRKQAEKEAREAEDRATRAEQEADTLEDEVKELENEVDRLRKRLAKWRRYHRAMAAYEDCLRKKQAALEELAKLNRENASALEELAKKIGEAADGISEAADQVGELAGVSKEAKDASEKAGELAGKLQRISNAMEVIDAVMRADDLTPSEKLEAMSKAFEELREWLPELPGVSEMLEYYNEAMKAIAAAISEIEDAQIKQWTDLVEAGLQEPKDAPIGIRKEVEKAARIRELMKIVARNCGKPPMPPEIMGSE